MNSTFQQFINSISTGKAILFTGAGFSRECKTISGENILPAKALSSKICDLGGFEKSDNLQYSSDRYLADEKNKENLVNFLKASYTATELPPYINKILSFRWKEIYTTNYDNVIELSGQKRNQEIATFDMETSIQDATKLGNRCIHINGYIETLTKDNIDKSFKLSGASYCNLEGFLNSPWYTIFKRSIERCSALVFIGYSLYDLDVKRILASISDLKDRTCFVVSPDCTEEDRFTISRFGQVFPCGVEEFARQMPEPTSIDYPSVSFSALTEYSQKTNQSQLKDKDVDDLLLLGNVNQSFIEESVFEGKSTDYVVVREAIAKVEQILTNQNVVITSELGNGKSIFLQEATATLSKSNDIYVVTDYFADLNADVLLLNERNKPCIIVIDDYNKVLELFDNMPLYNKEKIKFIISARFSIHETHRELLKRIGFEYKELSVDFFTNDEALNLLTIIDSVGLWGIKNKKHERLKFFNEQCRSQISSLLLSLLSSPDIKNRLRLVFDKLIEGNTNVKMIAITSAFLCIQKVRTDTALISEIAGNEIYDSSLRTNSSFNEFFKLHQGQIIAKSTIFCQSFIQNFFEPEYTMDFLLNLAESFSKKSSQSVEYKEIFLSTLRFSIIERLLPSENKKINLEYYYERLKRKVKWLVNDAHYWVQYAMAKIATSDYDKAQQFLTNAYSKAKEKFNYNTSSIDTQQARLFLLRARLEESTLLSFELFISAHKLLIQTPNDHYKLRQLYLYVDYAKEKYSYLDEKTRKRLIYAYKELSRKIENNINIVTGRYSYFIEEIKRISLLDEKSELFITG